MIPDYQSLMLPLLRILSDGTEHGSRDLIEKLAAEFKLTDEERKELLPSGNQLLFDNRVSWAITYLKKAGLIDSLRRATFAITDLGRQTLAQNPERIDTKYLMQSKHFWILGHWPISPEKRMGETPRKATCRHLRSS
jgi:restriction system protein